MEVSFMQLWAEIYGMKCLMQKDCQKEICAIQKSYISFIVKRLEFCSNLLPIQEAKLGGNIEHE